MSAETLKFFEEKSTEEIITWMIQNLSEEQIKMCLDSSDIRPPVSDSPAEVADEVVSSETSGSVAGSSSDLLPGSSLDPVSTTTDVSDMFSGMDIMPPSVGKATTKQDMASRKLNVLRKRCLKRPYVLVSIEKVSTVNMVKYYDFNLVEDTDLELNPELEPGDVNWILKTQPELEFAREHCNKEDEGSSEDILSYDETTPEKYANPPPQVIEIVKEYLSLGLETPIPGLDITKIQEESSVKNFRFNDTLKKALLRQKAMCKTMQKDYPLLYSKNIKSMPFFMYDYEGESTIKFYHAKFENGTLKLVEDKKPIANLPLVIKMKTNALEKELANGTYTTDDIETELQNLIETLPPPVWDQITALYSKDFLGSLTAFGMNHDWEMVDDDTISENETESIFEDPVNPVDSYDEIEMPELSNLNISRRPLRKGIAKQIADGELTEEQIREHMYKMFGPRAENLTYEIYRPTNSPEGTVQIKYISNDKSSIIDPDFNAELLEADKFTSFQGQPDINTGPGRFGDDEPLLFGDDEYSNFNGVGADPEMSMFGIRELTGRPREYIPGLSESFNETLTRYGNNYVYSAMDKPPKILTHATESTFSRNFRHIVRPYIDKHIRKTAMAAGIGAHNFFYSIKDDGTIDGNMIITLGQIVDPNNITGKSDFWDMFGVRGSMDNPNPYNEARELRQTLQAAYYGFGPYVLAYGRVPHTIGREQKTVSASILERGYPLDDIAARETISWIQTKRIGYHLMRCMRKSGNAGFIHGDLKSPNVIMIEREGNVGVRMIDFDPNFSLFYKPKTGPPSIESESINKASDCITALNCLSYINYSYSQEGFFNPGYYNEKLHFRINEITKHMRAYLKKFVERRDGGRGMDSDREFCNILKTYTKVSRDFRDGLGMTGEQTTIRGVIDRVFLMMHHYSNNVIRYQLNLGAPQNGISQFDQYYRLVEHADNLHPPPDNVDYKFPNESLGIVKLSSTQAPPQVAAIPSLGSSTGTVTPPRSLFDAAPSVGGAASSGVFGAQPGGPIQNPPYDPFAGTALAFPAGQPASSGVFGAQPSGPPAPGGVFGAQPSGPPAPGGVFGAQPGGPIPVPRYDPFVEASRKFGGSQTNPAFASQTNPAFASQTNPAFASQTNPAFASQGAGGVFGLPPQAASRDPFATPSGPQPDWAAIDARLRAQGKRR